MGRRSTTGGVSPAGDRIQIRFTWQGQELRPTINLKPTAANLKHARRQRQDILDEIAAGTFDLCHHFPTYKFAHKVAATPDTERTRTVAKWAELWRELAERELEHSTITIYWRQWLRYWGSTFGALQPRQVTHEMVMRRLAFLAKDRIDEETGKLIKGLSRKTQNNILTPLKAVFALACKSTGAPDPTEGLQCLKVQVGDPDPFSMAEIDKILADLRKPRGGMTKDEAEALADYYEFAAFAGPRPSEQIAIQWGDVDLAAGTVMIRRASVLNQTKERTKTHRSRTVELNARARAVIERQRARTQMRGDLVFMNPFTGRAWRTGEEQRREWVLCLRRVGVRHRPPKELRDTSVTLALSAGADPYWVAAQHGHDLKTMMRSYAKYIPRGDHGRNLNVVDAALSQPAAKARSA